MNGTASPGRGCVEERPAPYDVQDDAAVDRRRRRRMFVPMFAPDEPDNWTCTTSTLRQDLQQRSDGSSCTRAPGPLQRRADRRPGATTTTCRMRATSATCGGVTIDARQIRRSFTSTSHGLTAGTPLVFQTTGALYTGLTHRHRSTTSPPSGLTANTFKVSPTSAGAHTTFTVTKANPAVFTKSSHGLTAGTAIVLTTTGDMYDPLTHGTTYYVISSGLTSNNFRVSTTAGGSAVSTQRRQPVRHAQLRQAGQHDRQPIRHAQLHRARQLDLRQRRRRLRHRQCRQERADCAPGSEHRDPDLCKYGTPANKATPSSITVSLSGGGTSYTGGPNFMCTHRRGDAADHRPGDHHHQIDAMQANGYHQHHRRADVGLAGAFADGAVHRGPRVHRPATTRRS